MIRRMRVSLAVLFALGLLNTAGTGPSPRFAVPARKLTMLSTHRVSLSQATSPRGMKLTMEMSYQGASLSTSGSGMRLTVGIVGARQSPPGRAAAEHWTEY